MEAMARGGGTDAVISLAPNILEMVVGGFNAEPTFGCWLDVLIGACRLQCNQALAPIILQAVECMNPAFVAKISVDIMALPQVLCSYLRLGNSLVELEVAGFVQSNMAVSMLQLALGTVAQDNSRITQFAACFLQEAVQEGAQVQVANNAVAAWLSNWFVLPSDAYLAYISPMLLL